MILAMESFTLNQILIDGYIFFFESKIENVCTIFTAMASTTIELAEQQAQNILDILQKGRVKLVVDNVHLVNEDGIKLPIKLSMESVDATVTDKDSFAKIQVIFKVTHIKK